MSTTLRSRTLKATSTWDSDTATETKTKTRRFKEESRQDRHNGFTTVYYIFIWIYYGKGIVKRYML